MVNARKRRLNIQGILNEKGDKVIHPDGNAEVFLSKWGSIMQTQGTEGKEQVLKLFSQVVNEVKNSLLVAQPTLEEVTRQNLNTWKAPGEDGLNGEFF